MNIIKQEARNGLISLSTVKIKMFRDKSTMSERETFGAGLVKY